MKHSRPMIQEHSTHGIADRESDLVMWSIISACGADSRRRSGPKLGLDYEAHACWRFDEADDN